MWKKFAVTFTLIVVMYAFLPMVAVDMLGKFAIGWMLFDVVNSIFDYRAIGKGV